jgi:hypothetical protein
MCCANNVDATHILARNEHVPIIFLNKRLISQQKKNQNILHEFVNYKKKNYVKR